MGTEEKDQKQASEEQDLFKACRIIFGPDLHLSPEFLKYIQLPGVKSAFRRRAMESHPDRAKFRENEEGRYLKYQFRLVKEAYDTLCSYVTTRDQGFCFPDKSPRRHSTVHASRKRRSAKRHGQRAYGRHYSGNFSENREAGSRYSETGKNRAAGHGRRRDYRSSRIPKRRLLFGHYLYYMGIIDWHCLVDALSWQQRQKYRIGEMARKKGWLTSRDIQTILKQPMPDRTFGQNARARGLLTDKQIAYLLCQQKKQKKKIGEYFLEKKIMSRKQLAELLLSFHRHNSFYKPGTSSKAEENDPA